MLRVRFVFIICWTRASKLRFFWKYIIYFVNYLSKLNNFTNEILVNIIYIIFKPMGEGDGFRK